MILKNLTPHAIIFYIDDQPVVTLEPEAVGLRLTETDDRVSKEWVAHYPRTAIQNWEPEGNVQLAVPIVRRTYGPPDDLPAPEKGVLLVVSLPALVGLRAAGVTREDIVSFDTGPGRFGAVRNEAGQVVGCHRLISVGAFPEGLYCGEGWTPEVWEAAQ